MTAGISIPIFAIGCVLLWTPWSNRLSVVLVATFLVSLLSLAYADSVAEALLAARWGIGFGVAAWMLAAVVGFQRSVGSKVAGVVSSTLSRNTVDVDRVPDADAESKSADAQPVSTSEAAEELPTEVAPVSEADGGDADPGPADAVPEVPDPDRGPDPGPDETVEDDDSDPDDSDAPGLLESDS